MKTRTLIVSVIILMLLAAVAPLAVPAPARAQSGNLLANGGFEEPATGGATGNNWQAWWQETPRPDDGSFNYAFRPSWNLERISTGAARELIYSGNASQRVINSWDPWWAGVKQTITAPANARVRLTVYARLWTAANAWPTPSDTTVGAVVQVGIEPNGTGDQFANTVAWSSGIAPHNGWLPVSVDATVGSAGRVTLILSANYRGYSRQYMAVFFDEASLTLLNTSGTPFPTSTPGPSNTPVPGATLTPTRTPTGTLTPTLIPTNTPIPATVTPTVPDYYIVQRGDTLSSIARRFRLSLAALMAANNITDANRIFIGQVLVIRGGTPGAPSAGPRIHVVVRGDVLSRLARTYGTTVAQIKLWNNLKSDLIYVGQRLIVGP
jgi:LysM repeat protein